MAQRNGHARWREFWFQSADDARNLISVWPNVSAEYPGYTLALVDGRNILVTDVPLYVLRLMARQWCLTLPDFVTGSDPAAPATDED